MRDSIKPPQKRITQGTIFSCVRSPYAEGNACYGISITARCDTARDFKAPSLTFLPLVKMEDWLWHDALPRCIDEQKKSVESSLRKHLLQKDGSSIVFDTYGIGAGFGAADPKDKGVIKQRVRYEEAQEAESVALYQWESLPDSIVDALKNEADKLFKGANQNYYFVDSVEPGFGEKNKVLGCGFVAILRDIRAISRGLALQVVNGIDNDKIQEVKSSDPTAFQLSISKDSFCFPTGELSSPYIEQLMQKFSLLFGRIGTADVPSGYAMEIDKLFGSKS